MAIKLYVLICVRENGIMPHIVVCRILEILNVVLISRYSTTAVKLMLLLLLYQFHMVCGVLWNVCECVCAVRACCAYTTKNEI